MSGPVVVFTSDPENPDRGEIKRFDNLEFAERFVEAQVDAGVAADTMKVFKVTELPVVVTYRPVVSLTAIAEAAETPADEEPVPAASPPPERKPYERDGERLSAALERPQDI
jgi:hypothetical protein